jgi:hypothetical protein
MKDQDVVLGKAAVSITIRIGVKNGPPETQ